MYKGKTPIIAKALPYYSDYSAYTPEHISFHHLPLHEDWMPWAIYTLSDDSPKKKALLDNIEAYNGVVDLVNNTPGFLDSFRKAELCLTKQEIKEKWGADVADQIFHLERSLYTPELYVVGDRFVSNKVNKPKYKMKIPKIGEIYFTINGDIDISYSCMRPSNCMLGWNYSNDARDLTHSLWLELEDLIPDLYDESLPLTNVDPDDPDARYPSYRHDECWEQAWYVIKEPDKRLLKCMELLEDAGYLKTYSVSPEEPHPCWSILYKEDHTLDFFALDKQFRKSPIICAALKEILISEKIYKGIAQYVVIQGHNTVYLSDYPTNICGNLHTKTYGKRDCPTFARNRKFGRTSHDQIYFVAEENAELTGFEPCKVCMKDWIEDHQGEMSFDDELYWGMLQGFYQ